MSQTATVVELQPVRRSQEQGREQAPSSSTVKERWNAPRGNVYSLGAAFFSFAVMGANDAVYGPLVPRLEAYYTLTHTVVSLIFLSPFAGYVLASLSSDKLHTRFGRRGAALAGPLSHGISFAIVAAHPPFPVLVVAYILAGFGNGILDASFNAWLGNMQSANQLLGLLHAFYGIGATLAPLVASAIVRTAPWFDFYRFVMLPGAALELAFCAWTFRKADAKSFRDAVEAADARGGLKAAIRQRVTWVVALFLLAYVGVEVALGGWIVVFMNDVRHGESFASGVVSTGFWLGITLGRVILGFITPVVGEKVAVSVYLLASMGMELILWLVPSFVASAVAVGLLGFFLGPLFPAAVVATTKILPARLHVSAIGFAAAFGGSGACVLPFAVGAIAQAVGVTVLQPLILGVLGVASMLWIFGVPSIRPRAGVSVWEKVVSALWRTRG